MAVGVFIEEIPMARYRRLRVDTRDLTKATGAIASAIRRAVDAVEPTVGGVHTIPAHYAEEIARYVTAYRAGVVTADSVGVVTAWWRRRGIIDIYIDVYALRDCRASLVYLNTEITPTLPYRLNLKPSREAYRLAARQRYLGYLYALDRLFRRRLRRRGLVLPRHDDMIIQVLHRARAGCLLRLQGRPRLILHPEQSWWPWRPRVPSCVLATRSALLDCTWVWASPPAQYPNAAFHLAEALRLPPSLCRRLLDDTLTPEEMEAELTLRVLAQ